MRNILQIPREYLKKLTPGMRQWWEIKCDNFDTVLMFKVSYAISSHQPCFTLTTLMTRVGNNPCVSRTRSNQEWCVFRFANVWNFSAWGRNYKKGPQARFFDRGPPLSLCLSIPDVIHVIKYTRPSPSVFFILQAIKNWTVGRPGNKARYNVHVPYAQTVHTRLKTPTEETLHMLDVIVYQLEARCEVT